MYIIMEKCFFAVFNDLLQDASRLKLCQYQLVTFNTIELYTLFFIFVYFLFSSGMESQDITKYDYKTIISIDVHIRT